jgi:hypothetical protein
MQKGNSKKAIAGPTAALDNYKSEASKAPAVTKPREAVAAINVPLPLPR